MLIFIIIVGLLMGLFYASGGEIVKFKRFKRF